MARLVTQPIGLPVIGIEPLAGPRSVGAGSSMSITGYVQRVASPFGMWRLQISFGVMREDMFRRYRGWVSSLHAGANGTRWQFYDPDMLRPYACGVNVSPSLDWPSIPGNAWSNGLNWSNGQPWASAPPTVAVSAAAAKDTTTISLADSFWGHSLDLGDYIGFFPFHFGMYVVTEVIAEGTYRVWPPLRAALTTASYATLMPVLAMRPEGEESAAVPRGLRFAEGLSITLIEVFDADARAYFTS